MHKATAHASSDVALVKYWGKKDEALRLPENGSISMILEGLDTITTVEFHTDGRTSTVSINNEVLHEEGDRALKHVERIKKFAVERGALTAEQAEKLSIAVVSKTNFPRATGLSSSSSGFAALTLATTEALELKLTQKELSILARQGSGSACRCMAEGFVEWLDGETSDTSYSVSLYPPEHWDIRDVIAVIDTSRKRVSSTSAHQTARSSPFYPARLAHIKEKLQQVKDALAKKDFKVLGELVEAEALEFHSILLTSKPSYVAWQPGSIEVIHAVQAMRQEGVSAYFTINTGFNVHVLTTPEFEDQVRKRLQELPLVKKVLTARVGKGPSVSEKHLF